MRIIVCMKQVPSGDGASMDKISGTLVRAGTGIINPYDMPALETALRIREQTKASVAVMTMGPAGSESVLRQALAMGADEAWLVSDAAFAGADVYVTAYTLMQAMQVAGEADLIICGQQTTDGDTAQVPFSLAAQMGCPVIGWAAALERADAVQITMQQELTGQRQLVTVEYPCIIAVAPAIFAPRIPTLRQKLSAGKKMIHRVSLGDMPMADKNRYGLRASPTRVVRVFTPDVKKKQKNIIHDSEQAVDCIMSLTAQYRGGRDI